MSEAVVQFSNVSRERSLSDKVAEELTEAIVARRLTPGMRLPSERDLGEQFGVSRTVVREAVRSLAARGLVTVTSGRGVEVAQINSGDVAASMRLFLRGQSSLDYTKIHEVRTAIEVQVAGLAAARANPADIARLRDLCKEQQRNLTNQDIAAASEVDFQFHQVLARASGNELLFAMLDSISDVLREVRREGMARHNSGESGLKAHRWILKCVTAHDVQAARGAMEKHLAEAEQAWRSTSAQEKAPNQ